MRHGPSRVWQQPSKVRASFQGSSGRGPSRAPLVLLVEDDHGASDSRSKAADHGGGDLRPRSAPCGPPFGLMGLLDFKDPTCGFGKSTRVGIWGQLATWPELPIPPQGQQAPFLSWGQCRRRMALPRGCVQLRRGRAESAGRAGSPHGQRTSRLRSSWRSYAGPASRGESPRRRCTPSPRSPSQSRQRLRRDQLSSRPVTYVIRSAASPTYFWSPRELAGPPTRSKWPGRRGQAR